MTHAVAEKDLQGSWTGHHDKPETQRPKRRIFGSHPEAPVPENGKFHPPEPLNQQRLLRRRRYASSQLTVLSAQYVKVRGDLLVSVGDEGPSKSDPNRRYAIRCADYLSSAKQELESSRPNFAVSSTLLLLADATLAWLYPREILELRCDATLARLGQSNSRVEYLEQGIIEARRRDNDKLMRTALDDALNYLHQNAQARLIEDDLQVTRLRSLIAYISSAFLLLMLAVPYVTLRLGSQIKGWPVVEFGSDLLTQAVSAAAVSAIGAVGGIFSGLINTRDSRATLTEYRTSMLKLGLKPLVGAVAALTLYLLLSWQILTGVQVTSGGTFLLIGFLAGFSERYFLRLLAVSAAEDGRAARSQAPLSEHAGTPMTPAQRPSATTESPRSGGEERPSDAPWSTPGGLYLPRS